MSPQPTPAGRITIVQTDVSGSATMWERAPEAMRRALDLHDALLRRTVVEAGGVEARAVGTAFVFAFPDAVRAITWCLRVQQELLDLGWPDALLEQPEAATVRGADGTLLWRGLRVRMGVHTGEPSSAEDPRTGQVAFRGPVPRRAGRLAGIAYGGQVLLGEETWRAVRAAIAGQAAMLDLGAHLFRGLPGQVRIFEARALALSARDLPPLRTLEEARTNLLLDGNALVGRDEDLHAIAELFQMGVRWVTITGPPGLGKSRLARAVVARDLDRWSGEDQGGAWVCDLSESRDPQDLLQALGGALGVPLTLGRETGDSVAQVGHALGSRGPILLVFCGLDRLGADGVEAVVSWMRVAPTLRVLITAGERVGAEREVAYELKPLGLPDEGHPAGAASVRLLARRVRERGEGVRLGAEQQRASAGLLALAGGLPLAIEMLAGQVGVHAVAELEAEVAGRLEAGADATPHDRLRAVFDACLARLRPWERGALARCSVFRGGFDLEAAEAVVDLSEWAGAPSLADAVERLRELGMLRTTDVPASPGTRRYWVHPFIRDGIGKSFPPPDRAATRARHAAFFVAWAEPWAEVVHREEGPEALARLDEERLNLLAAVRGALALRPLTPERVDLALRGVLVLRPVLTTEGPFELELRILDGVIEAATHVEGVSPRLLARVHRERGEARRLRGRWAEARADVERALALARGHDDREGEGEAFASYGQLLRILGKSGDARIVLHEALARAREYGLEREQALLLGNLGVLHLHLAEINEARACITEAMERFRALGDRRNEGVQIGNLGVIHRRLGNLERTRELYWEALELHRATGDRRREGVMLGNLGVLHYHLGDLGTAFDLYDQALSLAREVGDRRSEATALANIGLVYTEQSNYDDALGLFHQALALNRDVGERTGEGCDAGFLGTLHHLQGDLDKARDQYHRALELLDATTERRYAGSFLSWAAACEADRDQLAAAGEMFGRAAELLASAGDPHLIAARTVLLGAVDLAYARRHLAAGDQVAAARAREAARARMVEVREAVQATGEPLSGDLRLTTKWLTERLGDLA